MNDAVRATGRVGIFSEKVAGALAYLTIVPALVFLFLQPYSRNRFVRFHAFQSVFLFVTLLLAALAIRLVGFVLFIIPMVGYLLFWLIGMVVAIGAVVMWLVLLAKALQGEAFALPVIGDFADRHAGSY